jgi:hypothetical protein
VLYVRGANGAYPTGVAWNGLTTVTESPGGADANPLYADNIKYLNLIATETLDGTIEAYTYPEEFGQCDGTASPSAGISVGQQGRKTFGLSYRTRLGNDEDGTSTTATSCTCSTAPSRLRPSGRTRPSTTRRTRSPSAGASAPVPVDVTDLKPTSLITIDSTKVDADELAALEDALYGTGTAAAHLPLPDAVIAIFTATGLRNTHF